MISLQTTLKYFYSIPDQNYTLKLSNSAKEIQYYYDLSQANTEEKEEDPSNSDPRQIHYISFPKLLELLTSHEFQDSEIFNTVLYGYPFITDELTLFSGLIERFRLSPPLNLSKNEGELFRKKVLKTVQLKVLIFLQHWFKNVKKSLLLQDQELEAIFIETLYCIYNVKKDKWLNDPMNRFFNEIEELGKLRERESKRKKKLFTTFLPNFINKGIYLIKSKRKELAQCLSLYDQANFERIAVRELLKRGKRGEQNKNYYKFIDSFNSLAKFVSFLLLNFKSTYPRIEFLEDLIDLIEELKKLSNFNSSYAIYLGISYPAVSRLSPVLHKKLSKNYKNKLETISNIFENPTLFREAISSAVLPAVPAMNFFTKDLVLLEETFKMMKKEESAKKMIDFMKTAKQAAVIKRMELYRTSKYVFTKKYNEEFINDFDYLPNLEEEMLYDISKNILP